MKKMKKLGSTLILFLMNLPFVLMAQEETGTYIDNLNAQDSSYMEQDLLAGAEKSSSGSTAIIIVIAIVIIASFLAALIDVLKSKFQSQNKLIWILVILFLPILGPILYFLIGRKQKV